MDLILQEYVNNYLVCLQVSKLDHRLDPTKPILILDPDYAYQFDSHI